MGIVNTIHISKEKAVHHYVDLLLKLLRKILKISKGG